MIRQEMDRRYGNDATIEHIDASDEKVRDVHSSIIDEIERRGLLFPVTVIDGVPVYDGTVSYPAILKAVEGKLAKHAETA